jgi:hypothetical protein
MHLYWSSILDISEDDNMAGSVRGEKELRLTFFTISQKLGISMEYLLTGEQKYRELSEDELELLKYFRTLPQKIKDREIGRLEDKAEQYQRATKEEN